MAVSVSSSRLPLPLVGLGAAKPRRWGVVRPCLAVLGLALVATVIHFETRSVAPVSLAESPPPPPAAAQAPASDTQAPLVTAPRSLPLPSPSPAPRTPLAESPRSGPALPPPPTGFRPPALPPQGEPPRALQGVYGTAPACPNCGWVESVQAVNAGGLPPGAALAAGAAVGAQAGAGYGTSSGRTNVPAAAAGAVLGASALAGSAPASFQRGFEIRIRMEDGSQRQLLQPEPLPLGAAVVMEGGVARLSSARPASAAGTSVGTGSANPAATGRTYGTR